MDLFFFAVLIPVIFIFFLKEREAVFKASLSFKSFKTFRDFLGPARPVVARTLYCIWSAILKYLVRHFEVFGPPF